MNLSSKLLEDAVHAFATLPGIGRKTALRLALHVLQEDPQAVEQFADAIKRMRKEIKFCTQCHYIADDTQCSICASPRRDAQTVCVVESIRDVMAIEATQQYTGQYHVLGGVISALEGIGPNDLNIASLEQRVATQGVKELIMALSPTIEGDTSIFYIAKRLAPYEVKITTIARGVSFGGELEYADETTLGRSILARTPYQK